MVSPINVPGFSRSTTESPSGSQPGRGRGDVANQGVTGDQKAQKSQGSDIRTVEDAMNVLKARLSQRLEQQLGNLPASASGRFSAPAFEAPSAEVVAQRILGFVQQRLQAEARAGADPERLAGLLSDARAGVEQGFAEAREQIQAMGLMNDQLGSDIDDSYSRIQSGLDGLRDQFVEGKSGTVVAQPETSSGYRVERAVESLFSFEVTTEEGDKVTVQMAEQRYSGASGQTTTGENGRTTELSTIDAFSGRYSFSVEGDLNSEEQQALAKLFEKVGKVSERFFDGDIQGAFRKAQDLNLGGDALASFSLSLTSTRIVSAAAYESVSAQPAENAQLRPLGGLARDLQGLAQSAFERGLSEPAFEGLMKSLLQEIRQWQGGRADGSALAPQSLMDDFLSGVIGSLQPPQA
ncbi:DUF5610 domain-containing protein [Marinobacter confluentis]|uniref:DUF5610 domain-containing protein n=1 Tax=Marinobacter confluentis TaxID=1697557 RepID=A0A4Z1C4I2_9GAMM|nr:DUF5610 domain-containing protein [Marinobacter confluentis]TGN40170.1 hypothetical protein E5Q11_07750 [Marinobacter confluentis]